MGNLDRRTTPRAAANRNNGAREAQAEWLAFIDDDCVPAENWLNALSTVVHSEQFDVVEGKTIAPERKDDPLKYYVENLTGGMFWSCNLAIRREVFWQLGGFDEDFLEAGGEDMEFAFRLQSRNLRTTFAQDAIVFHPSRDVTLRFFLWRTRLTRWKLLYDLKTEQRNLSLNTPAAIVVTRLAYELCVDLIRTTWHIFSKHDRERWRQQLFNQSCKWISFPFLLPYLLMWELRFRRMLKLRATQSQLIEKNSS